MAVYEIRVKGHLDGRWSEWFDGLTIANVENGDAVLSGEIVDQSALHGVLNKVRDLGLPLMSVGLTKKRHSAQEWPTSSGPSIMTQPARRSRFNAGYSEP